MIEVKKEAKKVVLVMGDGYPVMVHVYTGSGAKVILILIFFCRILYRYISSFFFSFQKFTG